MRRRRKNWSTQRPNKSRDGGGQAQRRRCWFFFFLSLSLSGEGERASAMRLSKTELSNRLHKAEFRVKKCFVFPPQKGRCVWNRRAVELAIFVPPTGKRLRFSACKIVNQVDVVFFFLLCKHNLDPPSLPPVPPNHAEDLGFKRSGSSTSFTWDQLRFSGYAGASQSIDRRGRLAFSP